MQSMRNPRQNETGMHIQTSLPLLLVVALAAGCGGSGWNPTSGLEGGGKPVSTTESPAAIVGGEPVDRDALFPALAELAGDLALRELALDAEIERELGRRGLAVTDADIERERERLTASYGSDEQGQEIVRQIFDARQLGPHRLPALLRRNAGLRKLIDQPPEATAEAVRTAYAVRHGPKRRVRLALLGSAREAAAARAAILERASSVGASAAFAEVAAARSLDRTAGIGGLLGEVSAADPGLSDVLRREVLRVEPGTVGDIVALNEGFAIVLVEADIPADGTALEDVRGELEASIRERSQRLAMEGLADDLIQRASVTPLAPSLRWSWQRASGRESTR